MKRFISKKTVAIGVAAGLILGASGAAFAYFTSTGNGSGTASTGSASPWTVTVTSDTSNAIAPGVGTETLTYVVTNAGTGNQELNNVAFSVADTGTCLGSWFTTVDNGSTNGVTPGGPTADLAPNAFDTGTVTVAPTDTGAPQNGCQSVNPSVTASAS